MDTGGSPAAKTPRRPLVFLVAAACVVIWARYRAWGSPQTDRGESAFTVVDLVTRKQRTVAIAGESLMGPTGLSGGLVALVDNAAPPLADGIGQVWLYDLMRGRSFPVTTWGWPMFADASGDLIVWYDGTVDGGGSIKAVRVQR